MDNWPQDEAATAVAALNPILLDQQEAVAKEAHEMTGNTNYAAKLNPSQFM